jgi:hypothetical protein
MSQLRGLLLQTLAAPAAAGDLGRVAAGAADDTALGSARASAQLPPVAGQPSPAWLPDDGMAASPAAGSDAARLLKDPTALERMGTAATAMTSATCVLPVQPTSIYEHSIAARPNFDLRHKPASSVVFVWVNVGIITAIIVGSTLEIVAKPA